jgi:peptide/nickel transport system substrate-binding protein
MNNTSSRDGDELRTTDFASQGPPALSRRSALRLFASGAGVAFLAACSAIQPAAPTVQPAPPPAPTGPTPAAAVATVAAVTKPVAQPKSGGTLRIGIPADLVTTDGNFRDVNAYDTFWQLFDRLTAYDDKLQPQPMLAESWDVTDDLKQFKVNLRKNVQWHTGRELTSDDVKYSILRVRDPKAGGGNFINQSNWYTSIDTPDKYTVILKSDQPRPATFDFFEYFNILDRTSVEGPDAKTKAVGTGPLALVEWAQGDHLTFARNPNYWQTGRPYIDGMVATIVGDSAARVVQLESGVQDLIMTPPWGDLARLQKDAKYQAITNPLSGSFYVAHINTTLPPTDNKLVRQALSFAMDRKRFAQTVIYGFVQPEVLLWKPSSPAFDASKNEAYPFDLDKARALIKQSGLSNIEMDYLVSPVYAELYDFGQIYQADLATIGVKLNVRRLDLPAWFDLNNNVKYVGLTTSVGPFGNLEPVTNFTASGIYKPVGNDTGFKNDRYAQLVTQVGGEPDAAKRKQMYGQLNDILVDEVFAIAIASGSPRLVARAGVKGIGYTMHEAFKWSDVWLDA